MGDSFNDISMVKAAGLGVAVRNAVQPLKDEADYITKATNDEGASGRGNKQVYTLYGKGQHRGI